MLRSYLTFAWRNLRKSFSYSLINLGGLALGIASVLLIFLYVQHEFSFDEYHEEKDRIYRITAYAGLNEKTWRGGTPGDPVPDLRENYRGVEQGARMISCGAGTITAGGQDFTGLDTHCTETELFEVFTFPLVAGSGRELLEAPYTAVISQSTAERVFGRVNVVGETFRMRHDGEERSFEITGVMEDIPVNTHFRHDIFLSFATEAGTRRCMDCGGQSQYLLLEEEADTAALADHILNHVREIDGKEYVENIGLEPLTDIHFSEIPAPRQGDWQYIRILSAIALVILVIACGNYMNLATARYSKRAREIGIRKVMGAYRSQLARQFLSETLLVTAAALPFATLLLKGAIPWFNLYADTQVSLAFGGNLWFYAALLGVLLFTGFLAGSYPAIFVSSFQPREVLQGRQRLGPGAAGLRKGLVTFQFLASIVMIAVTVIIMQQLDYVLQKDLGFDSDQLVRVSVNDPALQSQGEAILQEFERYASVASATASPTPATRGFAGVRFVFESDTATGERFTITTPRVDEHFIETMEIQLLAGRNISPPGEDESRFPEEALFNETAVEELGFSNNEAILNQVVGSRFRVTGVVENFHLESLQNPIEPAALVMNPFNRTFSVNVRLAGGSVRQGLEDLRQAWSALGAETALDYTFVDDLIQQQYEQERRTARVIGVFAGLSILIACMGLFGLAAYTVQQRYREIGIRKVLGAGAGSIILLLYKDFGKLILLATLISVPVVYYAGQRWLENFAYRIEIGPMAFVAAVLAVALITVIATGARSLRAALMNPVDSIRQE